MQKTNKTLRIIIAVLSALLLICVIALVSVLIKFYSIPPQTVTDIVTDNLVGDTGENQ